jgi:predicted dehydrogenase
MKPVRIGVVGVGGMGSCHARNIPKLRDMTLTAVCDIDKERADKVGKELGCAVYYDSAKLIRSGDVDAVVIATPHYDHTTIGIDAFENNLHVLVEKPISVHKADCERLIAAYRKAKKRVFCAMFMMRTEPIYKKVRALVQSGELGRITRINWIITNWFRTEAYYSSGGWRATWKGEGGGILFNQCPHNLDLLQWIFGMPSRVTGYCSLGKWHDIEVEDEVTAYLEYPNGATGVFITTTGEAPGTNRLEITGEQGKIVMEHGKIHYTRNELKMTEFSKTSKESFAAPAVWEIDVPFSGQAGAHNEVIQNFVDSINTGRELIAPAVEGINAVELANAMLYSSINKKPVDLPLDGAAYETMLKKLIKESTFKKKVVKDVTVDMAASFHKK